MSESTIGIKIANGEYYPILGTGEHTGKRLVLTTVNDNQESVQIDLYRGTGSSIENASYIGSLMIEDILPSQAGDPDIELVLGIDESDNLNASATDRQSGDVKSLSVSLDSVEVPGSYDLPDFELNDEFDDSFDQEFQGELESDSGMEDDFSTDFSEETWETGSSRLTPEEETELTGRKKKVHPLLLAAFIIAGLQLLDF